MKAFEEIKKGLKYCAAGMCFQKDCPYKHDKRGLKGDWACRVEAEFDALAYIEQLEDHIREVAKLVPKWISVEERLPEMDARVAVLYRFPRSETLFSSVLDYYAADPEPHFQHTLGEGGPIVCYWMPLPSAPEVWS